MDFGYYAFIVSSFLMISYCIFGSLFIRYFGRIKISTGRIDKQSFLLSSIPKDTILIVRSIFNNDDYDVNSNRPLLILMYVTRVVFVMLAVSFLISMVSAFRTL